MKPIRSKTLVYIFTFFIIFALLLGMQPALPVQADELNMPLTANGDFIWANAFAGTDNTYTVDTVTDVNGFTYITGVFRGTTDFDPGPGTLNITSVGSSEDVYIVKLDSSGALLWAKTFGGIYQDQVRSIALDPIGNVFTTGYFNDVVDFNPGPFNYPLTAIGVNPDMFISKLDSNGNFVWAGAVSGAGWEESRSITTDALGNIYTTGHFSGFADFDPGAGTYNLIQTTGLNAGFILKLTNDGTFIWVRALTTLSYISGASIGVDSNYHVYTTGEFQGDADFDPGLGVYNLNASTIDGFISHLDADGNFVHADPLKSSLNTYGRKLTLAPDDSVYLAGVFSGTIDLGASRLVSGGQFDVFIAKTDGNGNFAWARSISGAGWDGVGGIATDLSGEAYINGKFEGTADFDPGAGVANLTSAGMEDAFILRLDQNGDFVWAKAVGGINNDIGYGIAVDNSGSVYAVGEFVGSADFDPGPNSYNLVGTPGVATAFTLKLANDIASVVTSSVRADGDLTTASSVNFTVVFSESVTGVDTGDFSLVLNGVSGAAVSGVSGTGSTYTVTVNTGSGSGTIQLTVVDNDSILDASLNKLGGTGVGNGNYINGEAYTMVRQSIFADVPLFYWSNSYIERLYNAGLTGGCTTVPLNYCPTMPVTRAQTAVLLLRGMHGSAYTPPPATGTMFADVPAGSFGADYIEQLATEGITSGCGGGNFCPNANVTRASMAVFLVRVKHGVAFVPPTATGLFPDVPVGSFGADYIEQLAADGVTSGCGGGLYCPATAVKRDSMAVFLVKIFNLP